MKLSLMFSVVCYVSIPELKGVYIVSLEEIVFHLARWWDGPCTQSH